jgi:hypothetical protein
MNENSFPERVANISVEHPRIKCIWDIMDSIRLQLRLGKDNNSPRNLFVEGLSGVGKSMMSQKYAQHNPRYIEVDEEDTEYDIVPVLYVKLPDSITPREVYLSIIEALGAPQPRGKVTVGEAKRQVFTLLNNQKVEMLILDEMDYMLTSRHMTSREAMEAIKYISDKADLCLVCIGTIEIEKLRKLDFQFYRRFPLKELKRFEECNDEFCEFLKSIEQQINPPKPIGLGSLETFLPELLFSMCKGLVGVLTPIICQAYTILGLFEEKQVDYSKMELTVDVLDQAYKKVIGDVSDEDYERMIFKQENNDKNITNK